ncbi:MAG: sulfatase-like hydrolase/transferase, partial [Phycisphaeraceae bacterium]|nr:sulfatase-like hydrolase/transferase [Phycisphaeraceae bacterium]
DGAKEEALRKETAVHFGMATLVDDELSKVIDALKRTGQYNNTLIMYTTDHGDYLGNHGFHSKGFPAFEEVYNVPLIVKNPAQIRAGRRSSDLISLVDLAPTVLAMADCRIPSVMEGLDQSEAWQGQAEPVRDCLVIENRPIPSGFYQQMLVTRQHKLVAYMDTVQGELYDLHKDPNQYENLWNRPAFEALKREMLIQLIQRGPTHKVAPALNDLSIHALLKVLWKKMHAEEPVQPRTSFS